MSRPFCFLFAGLLACSVGSTSPAADPAPPPGDPASKLAPGPKAADDPFGKEEETPGAKQPAKPERPQEKRPPAPVTPPARDPTLPGPALRSLVAKPAAAGPVAVPTVELKGRILAASRPPRITLAVGSQLHMVGEGSRITLPGAGEIQVSKVTDDEVQLEILPQRYIVTLH